MNVKNPTLSIVVLTIMLFSLFYFFTPKGSASVPNGANVTVLNVTSSNIDSATAAYAQAGNVSEVNLNAFSTTKSWQGYFGNVSGTIELTDGSSNVMFNWSAISPQGEVYMSTNSTIDWVNIQCFNFTANGTQESSDLNLGGLTSLAGTNLTMLESMYGINGSDVDGVDETFTKAGVGGHREFFTGNRGFSEGECKSTNLFSDAQYGESTKFQEILLYEPATTSIVFASLLEQDLLGFDQRTHDFQAMVLEDGHEGDSSAVLYYFFVELS